MLAIVASPDTPIYTLFVFPQELHADIQSQFLPEMLGTMLGTLHSHMDFVCLEDVTQGLRACFKVLSKIQMPVAYLDVEAGAQAEDIKLQSPTEESKRSPVGYFNVCVNVVYFSLMLLMFDCVHIDYTVSRIKRRRARKMPLVMRLTVTMAMNR